MSLRILQRALPHPRVAACTPALKSVLLASKASISSSSTTMNKPNNAEEIEKLNELIKVKLAELEMAEKKRIVEESKPKISDFKRPIYLTLVVASTAYLALHWAWWHLVYEEKEKELQDKLILKQEELQRSIEGKSTGEKQTYQRRWWRLWS